MTTVLLVPDLAAERWPSMDRYASRLLGYLPAAAPDLTFTVAADIAPLTQDLPARSSIAVPREIHEGGFVRELRRYLRRYVTYPREVASRPADLVHVLDHSYAHILRSHTNRPRLVTVHDLMPLVTVRRRAVGPRARVRNALLQRVLDALRDADRWIVSTEWMRGELSEWLGHEQAVTVIPYGVDDAYFEELDQPREALRRALDVPDRPFLVLHVGSVVERKNLPGVFAALDGLRERGVDAWLLQVGGRFTDRQREELTARGLDGVVIQRPQASEPQLRAAYRAADALLFPSHYEGFGLPLLEAMASGLPIVTSAAAALAEVAGDAAMVIPDRDPQAYVEALVRIAGDPAWADTLRDRGRQRAWRFTWRETARRTVEVYRDLL